MRPKLVRWLVGVGVILIMLLMFCVFSAAPIRLLTVPLIHNDVPRAVDVVVVLGGGGKKGSDPLPSDPKHRVERGVELFNQHIASTILMSGGLHKPSGVVESTAMKQYALSLGLRDSSVVEESNSHSTYENAVYTKTIMDANKWDSAAVVTSNFHTFRSCTLFRAQGIDTVCVAAERDNPQTITERVRQLRTVIREYLAIAYSWVKGYL